MNAADELIQNIFTSTFDFEATALNQFHFQYEHNDVYRSYVNAIGVRPARVNSISRIPFLPICFYKTHQIVSTKFNASVVFESSGTTETINSRHFVKDRLIYEKSFLSAFNLFYGDARDWCIIGLLPSYLERQHSSLVYMVNNLIEKSGHPKSGFYLNEFVSLANVLQQLEKQQQKTLVIGVTFALLDFAEAYPMPLRHTIIMETGGMKGRKKEMVKAEVHDVLKNAFQLNSVHSEYGMTELLSQAYSKGYGIFQAPPWMRIMLREEEDPLTLKSIKPATKERGFINVIDLANVYSCSFIATDDVGVLHANGHFEVTGRRDHSDWRGCSLLAV